MSPFIYVVRRTTKNICGTLFIFVFHSVGRWASTETVIEPSTATHILAAKMGDLDDYDFSTGDAGASNVYNMEAGQIRVGG